MYMIQDCKGYTIETSLDIPMKNHIYLSFGSQVSLISPVQDSQFYRFALSVSFNYL